MDIKTKIDKEQKLRQHTISGTIKIEELVSSLKKLYDQSEFADMHAFWDLRKADFSGVSAAGVRSVMETVVNHWGKSKNKKAAIIVSEDLDYGLSRMYQALLEGHTANSIFIFRDIEKAKKWISEQ